MATFSNLIVSKPGVGYSMLASAAGLTAQISSSFDVLATRSFRIATVRGTQAGSAFDVTVAALDSRGRVDVNYRGAVRFTSSDAQSVLPADYRFTPADNGLHTFSVTLKSAGLRTLNVFDLGKPSLKGKATIAVNAAEASALLVSGFRSPALVSAQHTFTGTARDAFGNVANGYRGTIAFSSSDADALLPNSYSFSALDRGKRTFKATLKSPGVQSLTATDIANALLTGSQNISVGSLTAAIAGPVEGVRGQPLNYLLFADETGQPSTIPFVFRIDWDGNGKVDQLISGPSGTSVSHVFPASRTYALKVTAIDLAGNISNVATQNVTTTTLAIQTDPLDELLSALVVGGTNSADQITLTPADPNGTTVQVAINGVVQLGSPFAPTGRIIVYGQGGNDKLQILQQTFGRNPVALAIPAILSGDSGNDTLRANGSAGRNVLVGGVGNDVMTGSNGRDILIGSSGLDALRGSSGEDIVVADWTNHDGNASALAALMAEWSRTDADDLTRIRHIAGIETGGLNRTSLLRAASVHTDAKIDSLFGEGGLDWFLFTANGLAIDLLRDVSSGEAVSPI
jgi:hypothetical protein